MSHINNPFAGPPAHSAQQTAQLRFPDISGEVPNSGQQEQQYQQPQYAQAVQYAQQQSYPQQGTSMQQGYYQPDRSSQLSPQPSTTFYPSSSPMQYMNQGGGTPTGFQPQTGFGQHLSAQVTGMQQGFQQQQYGQSGYSSQGYGMSDLDPYANLPALQSHQQNQQPTQAAPSSSFRPPNSPSQPQSQVSHPRQYVQEHRTELAAFDDYSWKQLLNRVDSLRTSWEARKSSLGQMQIQGADAFAIDRLSKESITNIDSIHAAKLQLSEVQVGWRHSTDPASKSRVREALNAGLSSLPEFPPPLDAQALGGTFLEQAQRDHTKQSIMSGYQQVLPQQTGYMQPQMTGYNLQQPQNLAYHQGNGMQPQRTGFSGAQYPNGTWQY